MKSRLISAAGIVFVLLSWGPVLLRGHSAVIAGEKYWWLGDDAMISMRYAHNLAHGLGLVWNAGERVEGYSNFLWTLYMAFLHLFPFAISKISLSILLTDLLLAVATVPVLVHLVRNLNGRTGVLLATIVAYTFNANLMFWAASGFEVTLLTFAFLLATVAVLEDVKRNTPASTTFLLIAVLSLIRADAAILSGLLYGLAFLLHHDRKRVIILAALSLLLPVAQEVFRISYYHDFLPNTAYLKVTNWNGRISYGLQYIWNFVKAYYVLIGLGFIGCIITGNAISRSLYLMFLCYTAYIAYVGGDAFRDYRFFIAVLPLLFVLAFLSIQELIMNRLARGAFLILSILTTPLIFSGYKTSLSPALSEIGNIEMALLLKNNTSPNAKVADFWAGQVFYFSERRAIDLLGKSDRHIAHLHARPEATKPGHNKYDFDYSLGVLKPDFVIAMFRLPVSRQDMIRRAKGDLAFTGQLYLNQIFQQHCLPNPIPLKTSRTIFVCDWSPELAGKDSWQPLPE